MEQRTRAGARAALVGDVWTWGDGLSLHTLEVKFILVQEMLDPFQRHIGLQEAESALEVASPTFRPSYPGSVSTS